MKNNRWLKKESDEIDAILPFMSLLLIIIPVLLSNISFYQFRIINMSTPAQSNAPQAPSEEKPQAEKMVTANIKITKETSSLEFIDEETAETIEKNDFKTNSQGSTDMFKKLISMKEKYPKLENVMLNIGKDVPYDDMVNFTSTIQSPFPEHLRTKPETNGDKVKKASPRVFNIVLLAEPLDPSRSVASGETEAANK
jgi:biopolymer transport protein ExbD